MPALQSKPESANALVITDVGAAAIETMVAAQATFEATTLENDSLIILSAVLKFRLPNGLVVAYVTDDKLAENRTARQLLGIDLAVTDYSLTWNRTHVEFIGSVVANMAKHPIQLGTLGSYAPAHISELVRQALEARGPVTDGKNEGAS